MRTLFISLGLLLAGAGLWVASTVPSPAGPSVPAVEATALPEVGRPAHPPGAPPGLAPGSGSRAPADAHPPSPRKAHADRALDLEALRLELASSDAGRRQEAVRRLSESKRAGARILLARLAAGLPDSAERESVKRALAQTRHTQDGSQR